MESFLKEASGETSNDDQAFEFDRIAEVAFKFEEEWTPERVFSIEDALKSVDVCGSALRELFELLVEIDLDLGFKKNASIPTEEYVRRFPQWEEIVKSVSSEIERDFQNDPASRLGEYVDNYRLDEIVGEGGTGVVYKAFDRVFQRFAAVKFLKKADDHNKERLEFFENERVAMGRIPPGSAFVHTFSGGEYNGVAYVAMEFVDGIDLQRYFQNDDRRRKKAGSLDWREATDYVRQIAAGLITAHEVGVAHRDVKPANAMLDSKGKIHVLDLGFAGFYGLGSDVNEENNAVVGTRAFIAPEARKGIAALDAASDLYSLGGTYLFLLTGIAPSDWFDPFADELSPPIPLSAFLKKKGVKLPAKVVAVLTSLLEPDREKRRQTASDVYEDLNALITPKRVLTKTNALVFTVLLVGLGIAYSVSELGREPIPPEKPEIEDSGELKRKETISAAFRRGKNRLLEALSSSPRNVDRSRKDDILNDLRLAVDYNDLSAEKRGELWLEFALATMALGDVSEDDCERCVDAISQARKVNPEQNYYEFNGVEWNVFGLRRAAREKMLVFCDSDDERNVLNREIRSDAQEEFESLRGRATKNEDENENADE